MLDSDWLIPKILRSDWSGPTRASFTTNLGAGFCKAKILKSVEILSLRFWKAKFLKSVKILNSGF